MGLESAPGLEASTLGQVDEGDVNVVRSDRGQFPVTELIDPELQAAQGGAVVPARGKETVHNSLQR